MDERTKVLTFASDGYRTLCMSYKMITKEQFDEWKKELEEAELELVDRKVILL